MHDLTLIILGRRRTHEIDFLLFHAVMTAATYLHEFFFHGFFEMHIIITYIQLVYRVFFFTIDSLVFSTPTQNVYYVPPSLNDHESSCSDRS
ncbi:hypothetical protein BpHYR1_028239 [Brachionus plicatilis]|uniref:Uncharacterized protein n=1 Tax=Brachionus plicatilis TaxID=10195 RepID=A0A3M7R626_BRAPC|nr:hypothetical protein BpHYR1_028239 [Brachionus plicatilis]